MSEEDLREIRKTLELIRKSLGWIRWIADIILIVSVLTFSTAKAGRFPVCQPEASSYRVQGCVKTRT